MALTIIAHITAKEYFAHEVKRALTKLLEPTRREDGCIRYALYQSAQGNSLFLMYEVWRDEQSFERHNKQPYLERFVRQSKEWLKTDMKVEIFR